MCRLGKTQGLNFSPTKTVVVLFNRKSNHTPPERTITMNGKDIPYSTECRYLGLTLDERLKWMLHFSKKMQIAKGLLFKTKNALGITWGLKPHLLRWVYTGIVRPAITYGSLAWSHAVRYKYQLNQLRKVHGLVLRMLGTKTKRHSDSGARNGRLSAATGSLPKRGIHKSVYAQQNRPRNRVGWPQQTEANSGALTPH
jgi:hypothetical protein